MHGYSYFRSLGDGEFDIYLIITRWLVFADWWSDDPQKSVIVEERKLERLITQSWHGHRTFWLLLCSLISPLVNFSRFALLVVSHPDHRYPPQSVSQLLNCYHHYHYQAIAPIIIINIIIGPMLPVPINLSDHRACTRKKSLFLYTGRRWDCDNILLPLSHIYMYQRDRTHW